MWRNPLDIINKIYIRGRGDNMSINNLMALGTEDLEIIGEIGKEEPSCGITSGWGSCGK